MGNANCGAKARRRAAAAAAASRRTGQAAASTQAETYQAAASSADLVGASQGYGGAIYAQMCPEGIDQDIALLATAAALAVGIYVVYRSLNLSIFRSTLKKLEILGK